MSLKTETLATNMCNVSKQKGHMKYFLVWRKKSPNTLR